VATRDTRVTVATAYPGIFSGDNSNAALWDVKVASATSKAFSVIWLATWRENLILAGFRSATAASRVAITSKPTMPRMEDKEAAIVTWLLLIELALHTILVSVDS
jgi:hypothetical protein